MSIYIPLDSVIFPGKIKTSINIHGFNGCKLHEDSEELCNACCHIKEVHSDIFEHDGIPENLEDFMEDDDENGFKTAHTDCKFMNDDGSGCLIHSDSPFGCQVYHCSRDSDKNKRELLDYCLRVGQISQEEYIARVERLEA